jgi:hypothetical protein
MLIVILIGDRISARATPLCHSDAERGTIEVSGTLNGMDALQLSVAFRRGLSPIENCSFRQSVPREARSPARGRCNLGWLEDENELIQNRSSSPIKRKAMPYEAQLPAGISPAAKAQ